MPLTGPDETTETADVVALWRLQSRYADIVTRRSWPELRDVFLADATVRVDTVTADPMSFNGPDELGRFIADAIERYDHFEFVILNTVVDVNPGREQARGRIFMCEIRHDTAGDAWNTAFGVYEDSYRRVDDRWWIADRRYRSMARTGPHGGVFGLPPGLTSMGG